eukprot:2524665-Lingulodinium_polyedra.AAC.1
MRCTFRAPLFPSTFSLATCGAPPRARVAGGYFPLTCARGIASFKPAPKQRPNSARAAPNQHPSSARAAPKRHRSGV